MGRPRKSSRPAEPTSPASQDHGDELGLVRAAQLGDQPALDRLLRSYQRRLYTICYRMLGNVEDARDLTQDALVKIIGNLQSYDGRAAFSTWAIRITMNACLSHLRKQRHRSHASLDAMSERAGDGSWGLSGTSREPSPGTGVEREQTRRLLQWALLRVDSDMRAVLVLRDIRGLDYRQIADIEGVAVGTVKSRLFRARLALRKVLADVEERSDRPMGEQGGRGTAPPSEWK
ncbi:MAG: RNA polymerase sigma factor [Phycisphaerales bacterium]|nr:RNA polymerase sigma factor [Phycisphaerales bacterium]